MRGDEYNLEMKLESTVEHKIEYYFEDPGQAKTAVPHASAYPSQALRGLCVGHECKCMASTCTGDVPDSTHQRGHCRSPPPTSRRRQSMGIFDVLSPQVVQQVIDNLGGERLVNSLVTTVERLARTTDTLSLNLSKKTDILSSDVSTTLASTTLLIQHLMTTAEHLSNTTDTLVDNLIATTNALALNIHYLVQGCIVLVALLCFLTVICIVRWCYAFSRELRGVQHIKTA